MVNPIPKNPIVRVPFKTSAKIRLLTELSIQKYGTNAFRVANTIPDIIYWRDLEKTPPISRNGYFAGLIYGFTADYVTPLLPERGRILDIMCGQFSHFKKSRERIVHGIGAVAESLAKNDVLYSYQVQDINKERAAYAGGIFDAALICFGLPYLRHPLEILFSIHQQLTTHGKLIIICSSDDNYSEDKVTAIWRAPRRFGFEGQPSLSIDYLIRSGFRILNWQYISVSFEFQDLFYLNELNPPTIFLIVAEKD